MNNMQTYWIPKGSLTPGQASLLSVPATAKPSQDLLRPLLARKLQSLIDQSPQEAQAALEMSQEQAPELYLIAKNETRSQWAQALTNSDSMQSLLSRIDWTQPGSLESLPPQNLQELLEQMP